MSKVESKIIPPTLLVFYHSSHLAYTHLYGASLSCLGSLKCLKCLLQLVRVSYEWLNVDTARRHHLKGSGVAEEGERGEEGGGGRK